MQTDLQMNDQTVPTGGDYDSDSIQWLEGIEHIRKRPSMYIGDIGPRGLHHLVYEVIDNSIDEAMAGFCKSIHVTLTTEGSVRISDDGRGIPVSMKEEYGMSALELCLTKPNAGGKFDRGSYKVSGGLHGIGVSAVNALSAWLKARVKRDGKIWTMAFERGVTTKPLEFVGDATTTGTSIEFL
ncbi:MAG: ATP-binding protein, partial [Phycisphaerae bacterium]